MTLLRGEVSSPPLKSATFEEIRVLPLLRLPLDCHDDHRQGVSQGGG
jgi:hypothetical protein